MPRHRYTKLHSRYFCNRVPSHRVFPYDSLEGQTEAPAIIAGDAAVLLRSLNGRRDVKEAGIRYAYCWACGDWVQGIRKTQGDLLLDYLDRQGVTIRAEGRTRLQRMASMGDKVIELKGKAPARSRRAG